ncbi:lipopolysaccharide biosynthesis protein [Priestia aryabhattai]|uniref:lipopolysaccharide biosynthesis protein n=1 Tax=Priestia aryabhattai TaxID=412384 RepID=UPI000532DFF7|nr:hypothetical protein [Priestia aryabhattai]
MRAKNSIINSIVSILMYTLLGIIGFYKISIIIENYGSEINGLQLFITQFLRYLTLFETGFGISVVYYLYEPFAHKDYYKINQYYSALKKLYRYLTIVILIIGGLCIPIIFYFIGDTEGISNKIIVEVYALTFLNLAIVFPFSAYFSILQADQKMYISKGITSFGKLIGSIVSVILIIKGLDIVTVLLIELLVNIIFHFYLKIVTEKRYPFLNKEAEADFTCLKKVPYVFPHVIAGAIVNQTDSLLITKFEDLLVVSIYSSYMYIVLFLRTLINSISRSTQASFGNLSHMNEGIMYKVFKQYAEVMFFIVICSSSILFTSINNFVSIWIDKSYVQSSFVVFLFVVSYFHSVAKDIIHVIRDSRGQFKEGVIITAAEGVGNLLLSIILGKLYGLPGILLGTIISYYLVDLPFNTRLVYKYIFKVSFMKYIFYYCYNFLIFVLLILFNFYVVSKFHMFQGKSYLSWSVHVIVIALLNVTILFVLKYATSASFREVLKRMYNTSVVKKVKKSFSF